MPKSLEFILPSISIAAAAPLAGIAWTLECLTKRGASLKE